MKRRIVVLGAGVIGLSCAWKLAQDERNSICIVADLFTPNTTSDGAGGFWEPYEAEPRELIKKWSWVTKLELHRLAKEGWPVHTCKVEKPLAPGEDFNPYWKNMVDNLTHTDRTRNGHKVVSWEAPIVTSPVYLARLMDLLKQKGAKFIRYKVSTINSLLEIFPFGIDLIVNCMGHSAGSVLNDKEAFPIRGVLVHFKPQPHLGFFALEHIEAKQSTYVLSKEDVCILGGTNDRVEEPSVRPGDIQDIIKRCVHWLPELLKNGDVESQMSGFWVGIRPGRTAIRLELDESSFKVPVVHCYGHGGSGWTVHWGCAEDVQQLVSNFYNKSKM
uniref:FAD dependent oxidoreductase domain-containing protein n=1 Tax=Arcella intermedia TaxID=1963864 RepID=A0A6B2L9K3_9EUKA|eukprot:TRINITY_DN16535_c0_g1_i1.p1 TRINITY_DN16535_c0_g1~~TRINITY_DN16535_c0_g1_i1.p1  ORF type:complete len:330 (-),score=59.12 TRINITY_DN16535_c0_g1_i1:36-1025(-)